MAQCTNALQYVVVLACNALFNARIVVNVNHDKPVHRCGVLLVAADILGRRSVAECIHAGNCSVLLVLLLLAIRESEERLVVGHAVKRYDGIRCACV